MLRIDARVPVRVATSNARPRGGPPARRACGWTAAVLALVCATGCDRGVPRAPVFPAAGQVVWKGRPLANALVVFHPRAGVDERAIPARGQTDAEGRFRLSTYDHEDGAPAGEFAVTVVYHPLKKEGESYSPGPNVLPSKFATAETTPLAVRLAEGPNQLAPLVITR